MNEVTLGGETVFPNIDISIKPTKGLAVVWYSAHADGSVNDLLDHGSCPIVMGEKWGK